MSAPYCRAFEGANGWYVAAVRDDGSHQQPSQGPWLSERDAKRHAARLNREPDDGLATDEYDYYWGGDEQALDEY